MEQFWDWKRSDVVQRMQTAQYSWVDFNKAWESVKDKTDEMPDKGTPFFTDYYYWKTSKPKIIAYHPGESVIQKYYEDKIAPIRRSRGLDV